MNKVTHLLTLWAFVASYRVTFTFSVAHSGDQLQARQSSCGKWQSSSRQKYKDRVLHQQTI